MLVNCKDKNLKKILKQEKIYIFEDKVHYNL